jgi:hypothetical protein
MLNLTFLTGATLMDSMMLVPGAHREITYCLGPVYLDSVYPKVFA